MTKSRTAAMLAALVVVATLLVPLGPAAAGGCHPESAEEVSTGRADGKGAAATIEGCAFQPAVLYVEPGDEVTWINRDLAPHTVTGVAQAWGSAEVFEKGRKATFEFADEGVYPYYCALHPGMVGAVVVGTPDAGDAPVVGAVTGGVDHSSDAGATRAAAAEEPVSARSNTTEAWLGAIALVTLAAVAVSLFLRRRASAASEA